MKSLTLSDARNLGLCAAHRAARAVGVNRALYTREEESCALWAGIAETIQTQAQASSTTFHPVEFDPIGDLKSF